MNTTKLLFTGIHEVCRKRIGGGMSHIGYFDNVEAVLEAFKNDLGYQALYTSLNPLPKLPEGFTLNEFRSSANRSTKEWYEKRTAIMVDCDPVRTNGCTASNSTDMEKTAAWEQVKLVRAFLCDELQWPRPIILDSGNGVQARFSVELPADQATEDLIRNFLIGLSAKFSNEQSHVDVSVFEANRLGKLPGSWARKAPEEDGRPWRLSQIIEVPEREIELPASATRPRELVREPFLEPVPRSLIEMAVNNLPVPQKVATGIVLAPDAATKYEWLRNFLLECNVPILKERDSGKRLLLDIVCPWESEHNSTTGESSTSVWYVRGYGYGFRCHHNSCVAAERNWFSFRAKVDPEQATGTNLPGLPGDATHAEVARYFRDSCPEFHNHVRV